MTVSVTAIEAIAATVEASVHPAAMPVEPRINTVAASIQVMRDTLMARAFRAFGQPVEAIVVDVAAAIQPVLDAVAAHVQPVLDSVTDVGESARGTE